MFMSNRELKCTCRVMKVLENEVKEDGKSSNAKEKPKVFKVAAA